MNKKVTRIFSLMALLGCVAIGITSCSKHDENSPGVEFMPDMYRSPSLETNLFKLVKKEDGTYDTVMANRLPVKGTIARGYMPYPFPNTSEGYEAAGAELHNPFPKTEANLKEGEELFGKFCVHCHGTSGEGDGPVGQKLPGAPPSYKGASLKSLPEGKIFHTITYGKGFMGSHAGQLSKDERWKLVMYVQKLQGNDVAAAPANDSAKTTTAEVKATKKKKKEIK